MTERIGRSVGDTVGYGLRGATGTTLQPAKEKWALRTVIPAWKAILGTVGLVVNFASVVGLVIILGVFLSLVAGGRKAGEVFRQLLAVFAWVFLVECAIGGVLLLAWLTASS